MVDQKEEAKMEKFTETMPTMIQTHLIICESWADVKDKAKSLEHIIRKCDPPTPAMPLVTMGAKYWDYICISHTRWTKKKKKYPHHLKEQSQNKPEVEVHPKGNLRVIDRTHLKPKRQRKPMLTIVLIIITTMIIILPQVKTEATDLLMVKVVTSNLEASYKEAEAKDLSIINANFKTIGFREVHINRTIINMASTTNPIFREIKQITTEDETMAGAPQQIRGCGCGRANYQSNNGTYRYQYYTHDQQTEQYGPPCS